jgi:hypothetical protein
MWSSCSRGADFRQGTSRPEDQEGIQTELSVDLEPTTTFSKHWVEYKKSKTSLLLEFRSGKERFVGTPSKKLEAKTSI